MEEPRAHVEKEKPVTNNAELFEREKENSKKWNAPITPDDSFGVASAKALTQNITRDYENWFRIRDIDDDFTTAAFQNTLDRAIEMGNPLPYNTVAEYKKYVRRLDGMQDRQRVTLLINDCVEIVELADMSSDLGDEFKHSFIRLLEEVQVKWFKRLSDLPEHPTMGDFEDYDKRLHEHLELVAQAAYRLSFTTIVGGTQIKGW